MYPVRSMMQQQWGIINAQKSEGTPAMMTKVIGRQRDGGRFDRRGPLKQRVGIRDDRDVRGVAG